MKFILAIESSCDETAVAIYNLETGLCSNELFSQIEFHKNYGGVVPEIASKFHMEQIILITEKALDAAKISLAQIDYIAVTTKPGLPGSLMIGVAFAKALAYFLNKPILGINHLEGHVFSVCLENAIKFPALTLTASGGHTSLYLVKDYGVFELLGNTLDDSAGEAFDKVAALLNLGYPGGPIIEKLAATVNFKDFFHYPRAASKNDLMFSFSGLKTAVLYDLVKRKAYDLNSKKLCNTDLELKKQVSSSFLVCVADIFKDKISKALKCYPNIKSICFVGGVACNKFLREKLSNLVLENNIELFYPSPKLCTDNAAMIAFVAAYKIKQKQFSKLNLTIF